MRLNL
ncbi:Protein of unknown function [Pyronema omphalodes CBS 100304]